jgi:thiamine pyridinylase
MRPAHLGMLRPVRKPVEAPPQTVLNVGLYPYVPRPVQFEVVVEAAWRVVHTDVALNFIDYDCYQSDPGPAVDVFGFDCIYLSALAQSGFLTRLSADQIDDIGDFFPWALAACQYDGDPFAIPYLGCAYSIVYRDGDDALDEAFSLDDLYDVIGDAPEQSNPTPLPSKGLVLDLTGGTTDACFYLSAYEEITDTYPPDPPLPDGNDLDPQVLADLKRLRNMAGFAQASHEDPADEQVTWFVEGLGEALVGPTEIMSYFPPATVAASKLHLLPFDVQRATQPFYVDAIGVNRRIDPAKLDLAVELANLVASAAAMAASLVPTGTSPNPQYLISVRPSVLGKLAETWPAYQMIEALVTSHTGSPLRIGPASRTWLDTSKDAICNAIFDGKQVCVPTYPHPAQTSLPVNILRTP